MKTIRVKIAHVCNKCGGVYGIEEIEGSEFSVNDTVEKRLLNTDMGLCPKWCGGIVHRIKMDDFEATEEIDKTFFQKAQRWLNKLFKP